MNITVNGEPTAISDGMTVEQLLAQMELSNQRCAVEVNRDLVPRGRHAAHVLQDKDTLEIVTLAGGG